MITNIKEDLEDHGELHLIINDLGERDLREGMVVGYHDPRYGHIRFRDNDVEWVLDTSEIVAYYKPTEF